MISLAAFLVITATGIGWGWLVTESGAFRPIRDMIDRRFPPEIQTNQGLRGWISYGLHCPACLGFWPQLAGMVLAGATWWAVPLAITALVAHLLWLNLTGALIAVQLR